MSDVTELAGEWRYVSGREGAVRDSCAKELKAALKEYEWTRLTGKGANLPEPESYILVAWADTNEYVEVLYYEYPHELEGATDWRYVGTLDRPPIQENRMNKETRAAAIKRIQKAHDGGHCNSPHIPYNHCSELLKVIAAAERENEELRGYVRHTKLGGEYCDFMKHRLYPCTCGLDELLEDAS